MCSISDAGMHVQHIYFKNMYMWEGDCGAKKGSKSMKTKQRSSSGGGGGGGGGSWTAYTVSKKSWKGKSAMKTRNFSIDTIFNGGFCASFNSVNEGRSTCNDFTVEVNLDPAMFTLQKHTTSLRKKMENGSKGVSYSAVYLLAPATVCSQCAIIMYM